MSNLIVFRVIDNANGAPVGGAILRAANPEQGDWAATTNPCGDFVPPGPIAPGHYEIDIEASGFQTRRLPADLGGSGVVIIGLDRGTGAGSQGGQSIPMDPGNLPPIGSVERVHTDGPVFRRGDGSAWRWKFVSGFMLPKLFSTGRMAEAESFVNWARAVGANGIRVFLQHRFLDWPEIVPWITPVEDIRMFCDYLATRGLYVELTVLCDCQDTDSEGTPGFNQSREWQRDRLRQVYQAVSGCPNVFVEYANEPAYNGVDPVALGRDGITVPSAYGLYPVTGSEPNFPRLDYVGDHPERKDAWPSEAGKTGFYVFRQTNAIHITDEPMGCADERSGSRDNNPLNWEDAGGGIALSSGGGTFHGERGIFARAGTAIQTDCARRFFRAMDFIDPEAPTWDYAHDGLAAHPLEPTTQAGEVVSRISGDRAFAVASQPEDGWRAVPRNGWRIVRRLNDRGNILELSRS
jgi:hypothetical protein